MKQVKLPPCGIFVGSGIYNTSADYLICTMPGHYTWTAQTFAPLEHLEKVLDDNQGNLVQYWGYARGYSPKMLAEWAYALDEIGIDLPEPDWDKFTYIFPDKCEEFKKHASRYGAGILRFIKEAKKRGLYTALLYTNSDPQWIGKFSEEGGEHYLGYDFGERFSFALDEVMLKGKDMSQVNLKSLAEDLIRRVKEHVDERHNAGWGNVMATSSNFFIDYEVAAGTDIPCIEDFAFCHLNVASALSRGLYRQYGLPIWGSHLAHEHYSWLPNSHKHKFNVLSAAMYLKYMSGSKMIINESGNWFVEATLTPDSPKFELPRTDKFGIHGNRGIRQIMEANPQEFMPYLKEARKYYGYLDYDSPICRRYRKTISGFWDFVKANGTPEGQPQTTVALVKGNYDLCSARYSQNNAIAGLYSVAEKNPLWYEGAPERGWEIARKTFFPLKEYYAPYRNHHVSGTPFGQVDIVSFANDNIDAEMLSKNYKALLFAGWNTASDKQYQTLKEYVSNGGTLFISIPQLSTNVTRNYAAYTVDELLNGGDFSELCGVKVIDRGRRIYWAYMKEKYSEEFEIPAIPRRFGILCTSLGNIEITDKSAEVIMADDETDTPVLLRRKYGKGTVYFLNSWSYPGALDVDDGPGGTVNSPGLVGMVWKYIASQNRGDVWITDDMENPGTESESIAFSYFPDAGKICLYNVDHDNPHRCYLHQFGIRDRIELAPGEFRFVDTVKKTF